jgi:DNA-binding transcriptional regulator PaaX
LKNKGLLKMEYQGKQLHISLSEEGKKVAEKHQIDDLKIRKPKKWDKNWRILIFDIKEKKKIKREALRGKIIEFGLFQLQKSVWVYPYDFQKEIELLRNFFGLTDEEMQIVIASRIENDKTAKLFFGLK